MQIQCKKCNFIVHSQGENFFYEPKDINFCVNCGTNYLQSGTDIGKLSQARKDSLKLFNRIFAYYAFLPVMAYWFLSAGLLLLGIVNIDTEGQYNLSMAVEFMIPAVYLLTMLLVADKKSKKKFKELMS